MSSALRWLQVFFVAGAVLVAGILWESPLLSQEKPILILLPIEGHGGSLSEKELQGGVDFLRVQLVRSGKYQVVEKGRLEEKRRRVLKDLKRESYDQCYDERCRVALGRSLAADTMLSCSVSTFGKTCVLNCEVIPLEKEVATEAASAEFQCGATPFLGALRDVAGQLGGARPADKSAEVAVTPPDEKPTPEPTEVRETVTPADPEPTSTQETSIWFPERKPGWRAKLGVMPITIFENFGTRLSLMGSYAFNAPFRIEAGIRALNTVYSTPCLDRCEGGSPFPRTDFTADAMAYWDTRYFGVGVGFAGRTIGGWYDSDPAALSGVGLSTSVRAGSEDGLCLNAWMFTRLAAGPHTPSLGAVHGTLSVPLSGSLGLYLKTAFESTSSYAYDDEDGDTPHANLGDNGFYVIGARFSVARLGPLGSLWLSTGLGYGGQEAYNPDGDDDWDSLSGLALDLGLELVP